VNITIRDLDEVVFKRFKAKAVEEGLKLGEALTHAMAMWVKQRKVRRKTSLLELKPFNWGKDTEKVSLEIDQTLYQEKR